MKRRLLLATIVALTASASADAALQPAVLDEYCDGNSVERQVADATAMLIPASMVKKNLATGNYYIDPTSMATHTSPEFGADPFCSSEPYYGQLRPWQGRTAFLVGDQLMITAPHHPTPDFNIAGFTAVFGLHATGTTGSCTQPDLSAIPPQNVVENLTAVVNGLDSNSSHDYLLFQLPAARTGVTPLPLRRSGVAEIGDPVYTFGHPYWMTGKFAREGYISGEYNFGSSGGLGLQLTYVAAAAGSSGSPVFNPVSNLVETAISGGATSIDWALNGSECRSLLKHNPPLNSHLSNNGHINSFAANVPVPPTQLQVSSQQLVTHAGPTGGPLSNATTQFTVAPPPTATGPLTFTVSLPTLLPPAPALSITPSPGSYTLNPSDPPLQFTVSAGIGAVSCKLVNTSIGVIPTSPGGFTAPVRHRFEIGMVDYTLSSEEPWIVQQLGAPYTTRAIEVVNTRPHASSITVSASEPWLRVDNSGAAVLNLAAAGSPGDRATVTLSVVDTAAGFPTHLQSASGNVTFAATQSGCGLRSTQIPVTLTRGVEWFDAPNPGYDQIPTPPAGQTFGAVAEFPVDVTEDAFTVDDVDLALRIYENGSPSPTAMDELMKIQLVAPDGTSAVLWDRQDAPANYFEGGSAWFLGAWSPIETFTLDQSVTPPLTGSLNVFSGLSGAGRWKIRLQTSSTAPILITSVGLKITKKRNASIYSYNYVYDYLPAPATGQTFGAPADIFVDLSADAAFPVNDVGLVLGFYGDSGSPYLAATDADTLIRVELTSPNNTTSTLWDRNNAPGPYLGSETVSWLGGPVGVSTLKLDSTTNLPLGGGSFSVFNGGPGAGVWRVRYYTTNTTHGILPSHVNLLIGR